jgi:hypothetical protein
MEDNAFAIPVPEDVVVVVALGLMEAVIGADATDAGAAGIVVPDIPVPPGITGAVAAEAEGIVVFIPVGYPGGAAVVVIVLLLPGMAAGTVPPGITGAVAVEAEGMVVFIPVGYPGITGGAAVVVVVLLLPGMAAGKVPPTTPGLALTIVGAPPEITSTEGVDCALERLVPPEAGLPDMTVVVGGTGVPWTAAVLLGTAVVVLDTVSVGTTAGTVPVVVLVGTCAVVAVLAGKLCMAGAAPGTVATGIDEVAGYEYGIDI